MSYATNLALAQRLITKKGRDTILQQLSAVPVDSAKPWKPGTSGPTVLNTFSVKGVFLPHTGFVDLGLKFVDAELLKRCEQVALIAAGDNDLTAAHLFLDSGKYWRIVWIRVLKPGDTTILYAFGLVQ